jgi:Fe-S cluster assembly iron-binding protein IscA
MKLSDIPVKKQKETPFFEDGNLKIVFNTNELNYITTIFVDAKYKNKRKLFEVLNNNVTKTWKEVEEFTKDIPLS